MALQALATPAFISEATGRTAISWLAKAMARKLVFPGGFRKLKA